MTNENYDNREEGKTRTSLVIAGIVIVALAIGFMFMDNPADDYRLSDVAPLAGDPANDTTATAQ